MGLDYGRDGWDGRPCQGLFLCGEAIVGSGRVAEIWQVGCTASVWVEYRRFRQPYQRRRILSRVFLCRAGRPPMPRHQLVEGDAEHRIDEGILINKDNEDNTPITARS